MSQASDYARNVSDLYSQQGQAYANAAANKAAIWGGTVAKLGDFAANTVQVYSAQKQDKRLKDLFEKASAEFQAQNQAAPEGFTGPENPRPRQSPIPTVGELVNVVGPERAIKIADGLKGLQAIASPQVPFEKKMSGLRDTMLGLNALSPEMRKEFYPHARQVVLGAGLGINPADVPEQYNEPWFQSIVNYGKEAPKPATPKEPEPFTLSPGQTRFNPDGTPIANVPPPPKSDTEAGFTLTPGGRRYDASGHLIASVPERPPASSDAKMWVNRNGQLIRISESQYQQGDLPANTREQGRPVTSGDANRISDLDTSLNDLATLTKTIGDVKDATGTAAQIGAALPNFVTNATGLGVTAKQKQAVIDRVKQVIGKALEGGVLRKEDEYKYIKILPTIGDAPEVVTSKLAGLKTAIEQHKANLLSALADAGYDTSRFEARAATPAPASPNAAPAVGSIVKYGGKRYKVKAIKNGQAELEALP